MALIRGGFGGRRIEALLTSSGRALTPLCAAVVQSHCRKRIECGQMDRRQLDSCIEGLGADCERDLGWKLRAGVLSADAEAEEECIEAMDEVGCNALQALLGEDELELFEITDRCEMGEMLHARSGLGGPCAESSDCTAGHCPSQAPECHRCRPFAALNGPCTPGLSACDPGNAVCASAPDGGMACRALPARAPAGAACDDAQGCAEGFYCRAEAGRRTCVARSKTGEACVDQPMACAENEARCVAGKCLVRPFLLREGDECADFTDCKDGLYCKGSRGGAAKGRCARQVARGGACEGIDFGSCAADAACLDGRCRSLRAAGEKCAGPFHCKAFLSCMPLSLEKGFGAGATCVPDPAVGQPCNRYLPCIAGFCDAALGRCVPLAPGGAACGASQQCESGWCISRPGGGACYAPCIAG